MKTLIRSAEQHHILSLVIEKPTDIPMIRGKVKLLTRSVGGSSLQITAYATAASEMARLLLNCCNGGKLEIFFLQVSGEQNETFLEFVFLSNAACGTKRPETDRACKAAPALFAQSPFPALKKIFQQVHIENGTGALPLTVRCRSKLGELLATEVLLQRISTIRRELFRDTEESFMENLRAKHNEVLRLLREKTEQNQMLDRMNSELLELSNDLEALAQERTIIEMSLKIADQVRNPAAVIGGLAGQLIKKGELTGKAAKKIEQIRLQAEHIDQVVHQFHALANERGELFTQVDLVQLTKDALQSCPTMVNRGISPVFTAGEQSISIHANRRVLKVALLYLFRYAVTLSPAGGKLFVRVDSDKDNAIITIVDHGEGFVQAAMQELHRAVEGKTGVGPTGLSLVRHIMNEHQGQLRIEDTTESGEQGRFVLRFPLIWHEQGDTMADSGTIGFSQPGNH